MLIHEIWRHFGVVCGLFIRFSFLFRYLSYWGVYSHVFCLFVFFFSLVLGVSKNNIFFLIFFFVFLFFFVFYFFNIFCLPSFSFFLPFMSFLFLLAFILFESSYVLFLWGTQVTSLLSWVLFLGLQSVIVWLLVALVWVFFAVGSAIFVSFILLLEGLFLIVFVRSSSLLQLFSTPLSSSVSFWHFKYRNTACP